MDSIIAEHIAVEALETPRIQSVACTAQTAIDQLRKQGKTDEVGTLYNELLNSCRAELGDAHPDTITTINNLGVLLQSQGKLEEAEPLLREALTSRRVALGEHDARTLKSARHLGMTLFHLGTHLGTHLGKQKIQEA